MPHTAVIPEPGTSAATSHASALGCVAVVAITAAGAWLRFHHIGVRSLWTDEGVSWSFTQMTWYDFVRALWHREANQALYYLLLRLWTHLGDSEAMLRALSAVVSAATIPALYAVGRRLFGTAVGLVAAVLLAVNAYSIRFAQEARSYSQVALLVTLATLFFVIAVVEQRKGAWTPYVCTAALAIYSHFFAVLVVVAHGVTLWFLRRRGEEPLSAEETWPEFKRAAKWIAVATAPIWVFIATTSMGQIKWITRPGLRDLYWFAEFFSGHGGMLLLIVVALACLTAIYLGMRRSQMSFGTQLAAAWFAVPIVITLLFSIARPVFLPRYLIICLPALMLLAAVGICLLRRPALIVVAVALLCVLNARGIRVCYAQPEFASGHEDFRSATSYMLEHTQPGDAAIFYNAFGAWAYGYYAAHLPTNQNSPAMVYPGQNGHATWRDYPPPKLTPALLETATHDHARVWLVLSNVPPGEQAVQQIESTLQQHFPARMEQRFTNLTVVLYARQ